MEKLLHPFLLRLPPETAHALAMRALETQFCMKGKVSPSLKGNKRQVMGLNFPNAVGLAAGFDKSAQHLNALGSLGFGFIEVGGVTPQPQAGNDLPRIFRLAEQKALINRMGFNNKGAVAVRENLKKRNYAGIVGVNLGKNAKTPEDKTIEDYCYSLDLLYPWGDFFTINVSSPNTANLRAWQDKDYLSALLMAVINRRLQLSAQYGYQRPIAVKIAPDLDEEQLQHIAKVVVDCGIDGLVATNTTTTRPPVIQSHPHSSEAGGLSGAPLAKQSTQVIKFLRPLLPENIAIIGVGGIDSVAGAQEKLDAGANLIQIYTGFIYQGTALVDDLIKQL